MSNDPVSHPAHYTRFKGIEVIQLTEQLNFCRGNAVKYIARAGAKDVNAEIQDLEKAIWYIQREIQRMKDEDTETVETPRVPKPPKFYPNYVGDTFPNEHLVTTNGSNTWSN